MKGDRRSFLELFGIFTSQGNFCPFLRIRPTLGFAITTAPAWSQNNFECGKSKIVIRHSRNLLFLFLHSNVKSFTRLPKEQTHVRYSTVQQITGLNAGEKGNILTSIRGQQDNKALCFQQSSQWEQLSFALRRL
jgi:RecB family endonuclease NucS